MIYSLNQEKYPKTKEYHWWHKRTEVKVHEGESLEFYSRLDNTLSYTGKGGDSM